MSKYEFSATRNDEEQSIVIRIEISDHALAKNFLVPIDVTGPVEALAAYALHCLGVVDRVRRDAYAKIYADRFEAKRPTPTPANGEAE